MASLFVLAGSSWVMCGFYLPSLCLRCGNSKIVVNQPNTQIICNVYKMLIYSFIIV